MRWHRSETRTPAASPATGRRSTCTSANLPPCGRTTWPRSTPCSTSTSACWRSRSRRRSAPAGRRCSARRRRAAESDQDGDGVAFGLEDRLGDVAEVLTVELHGKRTVTADDQPVEVVAVEDGGVAHLPATGEHRRDQAWDVP